MYGEKGPALKIKIKIKTENFTRQFFCRVKKDQLSKSKLKLKTVAYRVDRERFSADADPRDRPAPR